MEDGQKGGGEDRDERDANLIKSHSWGRELQIQEAPTKSKRHCLDATLEGRRLTCACKIRSAAHAALHDTFSSPAHTGFAQLRTHRLHSSLNSARYLKLSCAHRFRSPAHTQIELM